MKIIGLTGGIASGKSTVARLLKQANIPVVDADELSREVCMPNSPCWQQIVDYFGPQILNPDQSLNRKVLGALVFDSPLKLKRLEEITHPAIKQAFEDKLELFRKNKAEFVVYVAPLLFEKNLQALFDNIILVCAQSDIRIKRIEMRDKKSTHEIAQILNLQMDDEKKKLLADEIIINDGTLADLQNQLIKVWHKICGTILNFSS